MKGIHVNNYKMQRTKWTERVFTFNIPEGWIYNILERLRGTIPRLQEMSDGLDENKLSSKDGGKWSIKEHIGHLSDLEDLHIGRLDDFIGRKNPLRAADMANARTEESRHNDRKLEELLLTFNNKRQLLIEKLRALDDVTQSTSSLHPRLKVEVKPVDIAFFTAEHDDHHLASIRELIEHN